MSEDDLHWPDRPSDEAPNPFVGGAKRRPLELTLHAESFQSLNGSDQEAWQAINDLVVLPDIDVVADRPGEFPGYEFDLSRRTPTHIPVILRRDDTISHFGIDTAHSASVPGFEELVALAHKAIGRDVLVSASSELLSRRQEWLKRGVNVMSLTDAAKLIGLLLRSKHIYLVRATGLKVNVGRQGFYWVLVRNMLPSMWLYFGALVHARKTHQDETLYLGQSILERCSRALMARDAIGIEHYKGHKHGSVETTIYHFDYLTLLLAGAFDSAALVARYVYSVDEVDERHSNFRNHSFLKSLTEKGATDLVEVVKSDKFRNVTAPLFELRNTIHAASNPTVEVFGRGHFIEVFPRHRESILNAVKACGPIERWGVEDNNNDLRLRPYPFSKTLVSECIGLLDRLAVATEVQRLFADGKIPEGLGDPPKDKWVYDLFSPWMQQRISVLG